MLFQRGALLEPRPTGGESSSGYGLAVAHDIVESLGGRIWCESTRGEGASFMFALPTDLSPRRLMHGTALPGPPDRRCCA